MAKNILLIQCYNANKGDNSVAQTMVATFKQDGYNVAVTAFDAAKAAKEYNVVAGEYMFSVWKARHAGNTLKMIWELCKEGLWILYSLVFLLFYKLGCKLPVIARKRTTIECYLNADVVVLPGGHFFTSFNSLINNVSHYYAMRFAQIIGKKTMVYAQTVGPYKGTSGKIERWLANRVLRKCDIVTLREENSLSAYNGSNCEVTGETVFMDRLSLCPDIKVQDYIDVTGRELVVGVTIHHIYYKHYFTHDEYVKKMAAIFDNILERYNCVILIIPMEDRSFGEGDRLIAEEMIANTHCPERIKVASGDLTPSETATLIAGVDVFIGTKTHSIVYGLKTATPTLSISYQQKSTEFMKMFGMERFAVPMNEIDVDVVMKVFEELVNNKDNVRRQLMACRNEVERRVERNNELLYQLIG